MRQLEKMYDKGFRNGVFFGIIITVITITALGFMIYGFAVFNFFES